jgi:hypothetical protein
MGYCVLPSTAKEFGPRKGLEGPFTYANGRVLYYDPKAGDYWDPRTDFYVPREEIDMLNCMTLDLIGGR